MKATKTAQFNTLDLTTTAKAIAECAERIEQLKAEEADGSPVVLRMLGVLRVLREQQDTLQAVMQALQDDVNLLVQAKPGLPDKD